MKISKQSWHYKLLKWVCTYETCMPKSLCSYFWSVVLFTFLFGSVGTMGAVLLIALSPLLGLGAGIYWLFLQVRKVEQIRKVGHRIATVLTREIRVFPTRIPKPKMPEFHRPKTPSLIVAYIKAKKQKVCPLIEYVDPNN